ncbi:hypothetical protein LP419_35500 [Massilia sp. H-1]|nr:hypothetical protein LP419_35500 [Massilia sp. H-1]
MNKYALLDAKTAAERALHELNGQLEKRIDERTRAMRETNEALKREIRQREAVEATLRRSEGRISAFIESCFSAFVSMDAAWRHRRLERFGRTHLWLDPGRSGGPAAGRSAVSGGLPRTAPGGHPALPGRRRRQRRQPPHPAA